MKTLKTGLHPNAIPVVAKPFGMLFFRVQTMPSGAGIYKRALIHAATQWLEEFSKPWKGGK